MKKNKDPFQMMTNLKRNIFLAVFVILALLIVGIILVIINATENFPNLTQTSVNPEANGTKINNIKNFESEDDFKAYLASSFSQAQSYGIGGGAFIMREAQAPSGTGEIGKNEAAATPDRFSQTNVQVLGIDEPDIVKTDGKQIYLSSLQNYYWMEYYPNDIVKGTTKIINAFPPGELAIYSKISEAGNLLLDKKNLVIFSGNSIYGYDVSNPKSPQKKWEAKVADKNEIVDSRLYNGKIFLVTKTRISPQNPCPIKPLSFNGSDVLIKCVDIYHPIGNVPVDVTYNATIINPSAGTVENKLSFVGSSSTSVLYMSENAIYLTYSYSGNFVEFFYNFLNEKCQNIVPSWVSQKLKNLVGYDISDSSKMIEMQNIFQQFLLSLSDDDQVKINNELQNRLSDYYKNHARELSKTGIVKISVDDLKIDASGEVAGHPLNQFSLDEYNGYFRIATTISNNLWFGIGINSGETFNDVYVLDKNLKITGSVKNLGISERIYSARFLGNRGYIVTFRQTDPFYVLDLTDPKKPELKGELKIPGYSSYLHPLADDKILGVGMEGSNVKLSVFDVKDPQNPNEISKYNLDEYWTDVSNNYHAFLLDKKHEAFFLPGGTSGYVFSYKDFNLKLEIAISKANAKRAVYIDDYLYIISDKEISVINENSWQKITSFNIKSGESENPVIIE